MKYLAIGDSVTAERSQAGITVYSEDITPILHAGRPDIFDGTYSTGFEQAVSVVNHGHGGWATQLYTNPSGYTGFYETIEIWTTQAIDETPDICSVMLGINDHASSDNIVERVSLVDYEANLNGMIDDLWAAVPGCLIVLMTPNPVVTTFEEPMPTISRVRLDTYADVVRKVAAERNIDLMDIFNIIWALSGESEATLGTNYTLDGTHLNQAGQDVVTGRLDDLILSTPFLENKVLNDVDSVSTAIFSSWIGKTFSLDGVNYFEGVSSGAALSVAPVGLTAYAQ